MNEAEAIAAVVATIPKESTGGWWALGAALLTAIAPKAYAAMRKVKDDGAGDDETAAERRREERQVSRADESTNAALGLLEAANAALSKSNANLQTRQDLLDKRIDTMAAERNFSIVKEATLLGELNALKVRFEEGKTAREEAKALVTSLGVKLDKLQADNAALTTANAALKARVVHLEAQLLVIAPKHPEFDVPLTWEDPLHDNRRNHPGHARTCRPQAGQRQAFDRHHPAGAAGHAADAARGKPGGQAMIPTHIQVLRSMAAWRRCFFTCWGFL